MINKQCLLKLNVLGSQVSQFNHLVLKISIYKGWGRIDCTFTVLSRVWKKLEELMSEQSWGWCSMVRHLFALHTQSMVLGESPAPKYRRINRTRALTVLTQEPLRPMRLSFRKSITFFLFLFQTYCKFFCRSKSLLFIFLLLQYPP